MRLSIVIPAFNEEQAVASTIERCLEARAGIVSQSPVDEVEVLVVNDGSTDRTAEIAGRYSDVRLISYEKNRGYGAALKRGFSESTGDVVGFMDADGTCDPMEFGPLCQALEDEGATVALGSRMGPTSRMPKVRRLGNRIYALILSALSNKVVTDTASGMRVIRREALSQLYPLPDGLHFTPAMSARVLMDERLTLVERSMSYEERVGESKLHVVRDGLRFLRTILEMTAMWQPTRLLHAGALACLAVTLIFAMHPMESWIGTGRLGEDMIYRLLFCSFLGMFGTALLSAGVICGELSAWFGRGEARPTFFRSVLGRFFTWRGVAVVALPASLFLGWLIGPGGWTWLTAGYVELHWSRVVLAGLIAFFVGQMAITVLIASLVRFHTARASESNDWFSTRTTPVASVSMSPFATRSSRSSYLDEPVGSLLDR
ncbi:MAG: glycosyltransferase family 2 protein [Planctomycetota bacterium]